GNLRLDHLLSRFRSGTSSVFGRQSSGWLGGGGFRNGLQMLPADAGSGRVPIERVRWGPGLKSPVIFRPAPPSYPFPATSVVGRRFESDHLHHRMRGVEAVGRLVSQRRNEFGVAYPACSGCAAPGSQGSPDQVRGCSLGSAVGVPVMGAVFFASVNQVLVRLW